MYIVYICILAPFIQNGFSLEHLDLNLLSSYEADDNFETFNSQEDENISEEKLEELCKNSTNLAFLKNEELTIGCKTFNEKSEEILKRVKRGHDELEGSGDVGPPDHVDSVTDASPVINVEESNQATDENEGKASLQEVEPTKQTSTKDDPTEERETTIFENKLPTEEATTEKDTEVETAAPNEIQSNTEPQPHEEEEPQTEEPKIEPQPVTETATDNKRIPKEHEEKINESDKEDVKKQVEIMPGHKGKTLISQEVQDDNDKSIKTDESTQKAGSKDTTILVVLFVAVVVVGALAFAYNFIKKRKRQTADLERVERNSVKRSLQNLTKPENNEPEKKPLMNDNKEVEMVNMKKENFDDLENTPSEVKIQS